MQLRCIAAGFTALVALPVTSVSGLNLVGGRLLVTASLFETLWALVSQSNWRFRTGGSCTGRGGVVATLVESTSR